MMKTTAVFYFTASASLYLVWSQAPGIHLMSSCCALTTGSCRSVCENTSLVDLATNTDDRWRYISRLTSFCSQQLLPFWSCMNETLFEIDRGQGFFGRPCCTLPQSQACVMVCLNATGRDELKSACRASDEIIFYSCLDRQEVGQRCCGPARRTECHTACREVFSTSTAPSAQMRAYLSNACAQDNPFVTQCVQNYSLITPAENPTRNLHCCDKSPNSQCRAACQNILRTQTIGQEIVDNLIEGGCGLPMPDDKLWQCFLANADTVKPEPKAVNHLDNLGMDSSKILCCFRAATLTCQRLCIKTFSNEWEITWGEFDRQCQYQLAESAMLQCLSEVEEPCELGCEGLTYCTNFNYRPTELFRNCDSRTDQAARHDVELWGKGIIRMPMIDIPVQDIASCFPDTWKTIACALQIKPCHNQAHVNMICKSDCIKILNECVDISRLKPGQTASTLCEVLSPPGNNPSCISLSLYLDESKHLPSASDVTHPCKRNPCNHSEVCIVNRNCHFGEVCLPYKCVPGCRMGAMSQLVVPGGTYVQVPRIYKGKQEKHCHSVCYCSKLGVLENCVAMPCVNKGQCTIEGTQIAHKSQYYKNCTACFCNAGELRCTKTCQVPELQNHELLSGSLCNCPDHYVPVCGNNGKTYPSPCLARCSGLRDGQFESGSCSDLNPCKDNPCGPNQKCLIRRQVCLSSRKKCSQYICVNLKDNCDYEPLSPVCDDENDEHPNPCLLLFKKRQFSYWGRCLQQCKIKSKVCGYDGQEYVNECAAKANDMIVDYSGSCVPSHSVFFKSHKLKCPGVQCHPLPSQHCTGILPPNACCPICGAALKLVFSQKLLDQAVQASQSISLATVRTMTQKLKVHVKTAECDVFAYLGLDVTVIVLIEPNSPDPSALQVEACVREAEKLQALVEQQSPTILMELPLSSLIGGFIIKPQSGSTNQAPIFYHQSYQLVIVLYWTLFFIHQGNIT